MRATVTPAVYTSYNFVKQETRVGPVPRAIDLASLNYGISVNGWRVLTNVPSTYFPLVNAGIVDLADLGLKLLVQGNGRRGYDKLRLATGE